MKRMKKVLYLIVPILFTILFTTSKVFGQTTLEEYNYVTKGYKIQLESGLDMKKGYVFEDIDKQTTKEREASLKVLYKVKNENKIIVAYLIVYKRYGLPAEYICIPNPNSDQEILNKYWMQLYDGSTLASERLQLICYLISKRMKW
jgi:hypothetical protein